MEKNINVNDDGFHVNNFKKNHYEVDMFTPSQNHEYRMVCEQTKQKQLEIEILKLRIKIEKISRKRKLEIS